MADLGTFNASEHQSNDFDAVPPAWYPVIITKSDKTESKSTPGNSYLKVECTIADGPFKGRKLWTNLNLWNSNETAQRIAESDLADICRAVGIESPQESSRLHDIPFGVKVEHREWNGRMQEEIKGYCSEKDLLNNMATNPGPAATGNNPAPWSGQQPGAPAEAPAQTGTPPAGGDNLKF